MREKPNYKKRHTTSLPCSGSSASSFRISSRTTSSLTTGLLVSSPPSNCGSICASVEVLLARRPDSGLGVYKKEFLYHGLKKDLSQL